MKRNLGLDVVRSIAIWCTLAAHGMTLFLYPFLEKNRWTESLYAFTCFLGYLGVEIFFVLSGFLIGMILLRQMSVDFRWREMTVFWVRRWLRTLPLYYLVLFFLAWQADYIPFLDLFFLQSFSLETLDLFAVAWSLSIEEWFYLLLPLLFLGISFCGKKETVWQRIGWGLIGLIILENMLRFFYVLHFQPTYDDGVRKVLFLRFDALALGVLLAYGKIYFTDWYMALKKRVFWLGGLLLGIGGMVYFCQQSTGLDGDLFAKTGLFTLISLAIVLCLPAAEEIKGESKMFTRCSLYSYSIYLIHLTIYQVWQRKAISLASGGIALLGALASTFILAHLFYWGIEKPILAYRDRKFPSRQFGR